MGVVAPLPATPPNKSRFSAGQRATLRFISTSGWTHSCVQLIKSDAKPGPVPWPRAVGCAREGKPSAAALAPGSTPRSLHRGPHHTCSPEATRADVRGSAEEPELSLHPESSLAPPGPTKQGWPIPPGFPNFPLNRPRHAGTAAGLVVKDGAGLQTRWTKHPRLRATLSLLVAFA